MSESLGSCPTIIRPLIRQLTDRCQVFFVLQQCLSFNVLILIFQNLGKFETDHISERVNQASHQCFFSWPKIQPISLSALIATLCSSFSVYIILSIYEFDLCALYAVENCGISNTWNP